MMQLMMVMAATSAKLELGDCAAVCHLIRRPTGLSTTGAHCSAAFGFVAFGGAKLMSWDPKSTNAPPYIALAGGLLQAGRIVEPDALPPATLQAPPRQRDHWQRLSNLSVKHGWARLLDFASVFEMGGIFWAKAGWP